jgi:hypothetical protein
MKTMQAPSLENHAADKPRQRAKIMRAPSVFGTIGNTPHIRMNGLFGNAELWIKSERSNPGGSIENSVA